MPPTGSGILGHKPHKFWGQHLLTKAIYTLKFMVLSTLGRGLGCYGTWPLKVLQLSTCVVFQLQSHVQIFATPWTPARQSPRPSPPPGVHSSSGELNHWCHPTISSSATLFSFCLQSFPATGSFPVSRLFASGGQSIGASASTSVLPMSIWGWLPLGLSVLISFTCKGL